jgi:hypothetical protein
MPAVSARVYAATGDAVVRIDEGDGVWSARLTLEGSGAQCLAVVGHAPDRVVALGLGTAAAVL